MSGAGAESLAGQEAKLVWVASMTRSGSMWVYNVARDLLRSAGRNVLPEPVPQGDADMMAQAARGLEDRNPRNVWVLKVHMCALQRPSRR